MEEMIQIMKRNIHNELKRRINGSIYVNIVDDVLTVQVKHNGICWNVEYHSVIKKLATEPNFKQYIVNNVVQGYEKYIHSLYFYN